VNKKYIFINLSNNKKGSRWEVIEMRGRGRRRECKVGEK